METQWIAGTGFSRGIGFELAKQIQSRGYKLFHIGRKPTGFEDAFLSCDLSLPFTNTFLQSFQEEFKKMCVHGFFYGAGIFPALTYTASDVAQQSKFWESQSKAMRVNYLSCAQLIETSIPFILQKNKSRPFLAHLSSLAAVDPLPGFELYGTTKFATLKYFHDLSKKFNAEIMSCLSIHPGTVKTDMLDEIIVSAEYRHLDVVDILNHEIKENRVISAQKSAQLISSFLFDASHADLRQTSHGKLYIADQNKIFQSSTYIHWK